MQTKLTWLIDYALGTTIDLLLVKIFQSSRTRNKLFIFLNLTVDRDRTVSRRSEPNSRTFLTSEQLDP